MIFARSRWVASAILLALLAGGRAEEGCTITATGVNFGTYDVVAAAPVDSTGRITFLCDLLTSAVSIFLDRGGASTFAGRRMLKGSEPLLYNLFIDPARSSIWGDGTEGTSTYVNSNPVMNIDVIVPIFGRIPARQDVSAGRYTSTVTAIINF